MAKKTTTTKKSGTPAVAKSAAAPVTTAVRNSAIPPKTSAAKKMAGAITHEQIALTAYFIWQSGRGGSQDDNWFAAERQLRGI